MQEPFMEFVEPNAGLDPDSFENNLAASHPH